MLTELRSDGRAVSFFGDLHPSWAGNVVKAMASATIGYPIVSRVLDRVTNASGMSESEFFASLDRELRATVERVVRLTPTIVEVIVRAPAAARAFLPGQFYRLQNYESLAREVNGTRLAMEGIALTGAWVDREQGLVSTIVLEMGGSSNLCANLKPGEPVVLMGPTGTPTEIEPGETVVLAGGGLGNAVLFSIGQAFRRAGSRVLYFAGYKKLVDRYKVAEIEAAADVVVWCSDEAPGFVPGRPQDRSYVGNIVEGMRAYAAGELGPPAIAMSTTDRVIAIGSEGMMAAVAAARSTVLAPYLKPGHRAHRLDQLADAMHDEGSLRPVPAASCRSGHRQAQLRLQLLQPGPAARPRRLRGARCAAAAEQRAGKTDRAVDSAAEFPSPVKGSD